VSTTADITLLLEGTYPYVRGGVSSCVHQLVRAMPDVTFSIFYIGSHRKLAQDPKYDIPKNVLAIEPVFLFDGIPPEELVPGPYPKEADAFYDALEQLCLAKSQREGIKHFWNVIQAHATLPQNFTFANLCRDRRGWDLLVTIYDHYMPDTSFVDYFWTARFVLLPTWLLLRSLHKVPVGKTYLSLCTGYAGLMGAICAKQQKRNLMITEHGIYTKEREEEINRAEWIYEPDDPFFDYTTNWRKLKELWIRSFQFTALVGYETAYSITTLHEGNRNLQIEYGAAEHKTRIVPNGINPQDFDEALRVNPENRRKRPGKFLFAFIGRVVPIKDVKTLIRAAQIVHSRRLDAEFLIYGPTEEDKEYADECRLMVESLDLTTSVKFMGSGKPSTILTDCDAVILTSLSEGQPLVALEAFAAGVPLITTDVGSCRELVFGRNAPDQALGRAGFLTRIGAPTETADAICKFIKDPALIETMGAVGRKRVEMVYQEKLVMSQYRALFRSMHPEVG